MINFSFSFNYIVGKPINLSIIITIIMKFKVITINFASFLINNSIIYFLFLNLIN